MQIVGWYRVKVYRQLVDKELKYIGCSLVKS